MNPGDWTPEQYRNALMYGSCRTCSTPREMHRTETVEDGVTEVFHSLIAPCGHQQNPDELLDPVAFPPLV